MLSLMSSIIWDSVSNLTSPSYYIFISTSAKQFQNIDMIFRFQGRPSAGPNG